MSDPRRALPAVGTVLELPSIRELMDHAPRSVVTDAVRVVIEEARRDPTRAPGNDEDWYAAVAAHVADRLQPSLRAVFNATGVILHTNLGRAPLAAVAIDAVARTAAGASNLEYDLERGERGSRHVHCAALLRELTGAEDAMVVNNCAAALVLALNTFANGRYFLFFRGDLIYIGL